MFLLKCTPPLAHPGPLTLASLGRLLSSSTCYWRKGFWYLPALDRSKNSNSIRSTLSKAQADGIHASAQRGATLGPPSTYGPPRIDGRG